MNYRCIEPAWCPPGETDTFDSVDEFSEWCMRHRGAAPILYDRGSKGAEYHEMRTPERLAKWIDAGDDSASTTYTYATGWRLVLVREV